MSRSKATLKHMAPILAAGATTLQSITDVETPFKSDYKHYLKPKKKAYIPNSLWLPDPDTAVFPPHQNRPSSLRIELIDLIPFSLQHFDTDPTKF